ncbi:Dynein light chain 1, cytoplasmic [Microtus ochrogaster]|uniref:Dynein light chain n=1 Tax=Microtus ochrogaster TaxID=79684 RepID=A0A8J6GHF9_MICOH|nr:Dynein light chain 1, cytoplasmic [Microtus ochrogaster]
MCDQKAVIKNADMLEEIQQDSVECTTQALEKYNIEKDIAAHIKKEFDKKYNPIWHCIVGQNFGSYVTHETKHSTWVRWPFFCSNLVKSMDCAKYPVIHPKTRTAS